MAGACAPWGLLGNVVLIRGGAGANERGGFLHKFFWPLGPAFRRDPSGRSQVLRANSPISCLFREVTSNSAGEDPGLQAKNQAAGLIPAFLSLPLTRHGPRLPECEFPR